MNQNSCLKISKKICLLLVCLTAMLAFPAGALADDAALPAAEELGFYAEAEHKRNANGSLKVRGSDTVVPLEEGQKLSIRWNESAGWLCLEWMETPAAYTVCEFDAEDVELARTQVSDGSFLRYLPLREETRRVEVSAEGTGAELHVAKVYSAGTLPLHMENLRPSAEKADILLISTHPDDEHVFMGGIQPTYEGDRGYVVQVLYMTNQNQNRKVEAVNSCAVCKNYHFPIFAGFPDIYSIKDPDAIEEAWGREETLTYLVEQLRKLRPEVVVTHDVDGEYGHGAHIFTCECVRIAAEAAADPAQYPESAERYGTWQVKKLYLHMYPEGQLELDWEQPLAAFDGKTAFEMAEEGYAQHRSQHKYGFVVEKSGRYACNLYGLYSSTVGPDVAKNDLLENIPAEVLSNFVPTPTPIPTQAPTPAPTAEQTAQPIVETAAESEGNDRSPKLLLWLLPLAAVLVILPLHRLTKEEKDQAHHEK